jgi:hypothetical protein
MIVRISQEHEQGLNRRSPPYSLKAFHFSIAEHLLRKTARLLPTAGFSTHDDACHNLLQYIIRNITYLKRRTAVNRAHAPRINDDCKKRARGISELGCLFLNRQDF